MLFPGTKNSNIVIDVGLFSLESSECVKLLGITIDSGLTFYPHVQDICSKAAQKTKTILRIRSFLNQDQADLLFNSFILSAFNIGDVPLDRVPFFTLESHLGCLFSPRVPFRVSKALSVRCSYTNS